MKQMQFRIYRYVFKPSLIGVILTLICVPLFINFGLWQYSKAAQKQAIQLAYNNAKLNEALKFPTSNLSLETLNLDDWKFKKVTVTGVYDTNYQYLLDNQVEGTRVGYHVITPLKINQSSEYVLINRGWILGENTHAKLPMFITPVGSQTITGQIWVPSKKIFTLEDESTLQKNGQKLQAVWQNMDMDKYQRIVPFKVSPMVIKLDQNSDAGGFVRNWQVPAQRIATHMGYAYQWFGFAFATLLIFFYMSVSRVRSESSADIRSQ